MRKYSLLLVPILMLSCGGGEDAVDTNTEDLVSIDSTVMIEFETPLRPNQTLFDLSITYFDTVEFDYFVDESDYWYAIVLGEDGEIVALARDLPMDEVLSGSQLLIEWEVDSLYEAGEGEELYFKERLVDYEVLVPGVDVKSQLLGYMQSYTINDINALSDYTHVNIGQNTAYNPGAACALGGFVPEAGIEYSPDWMVREGVPDGDFCEGYADVSDGLYYEEITADGLPSYLDMANDEMGMVQLSISDKVDVDKIFKVIVIIEEQHWGYLYFVEEDGLLYNLMTDRCDCSA